MAGEWRTRWRYVAGLLWCGVVAWFAFFRGTRVPLLWRADFGFHELGHLLTYPLPDIVTAAMGSITQIGVPLLLAAYFFVFRQDMLGVGACAAWAAASAQDASVYIADAPYENLPLIGGHHDWAYVFGPQGLDTLGAAGPTARVVWAFGLLLLLAGAGACALGMWQEAHADGVAVAPAAGVDALEAHQRDILPR